jgi:hypothetical protein
MKIVKYLYKFFELQCKNVNFGSFEYSSIFSCIELPSI